MRRPFKARPTVRPVLIEGRDTSTTLPVLLDQAALRVGSPIWVRLTTREDSWQQGVITEIAHAVVHVRLLNPDA